MEQAPSLPNNDRWKNSHNQAVERFTYRGKSYSLFATSNHPRKKASLALAIPFQAGLRAHQGVRHFSGPLTLSSAHAQLVAGMQIIREITCEHKETQPQVLLPEFGLFCSQPLLSRLSTSAERFLSPNARYPHKVSAFTASLPFRTANRTDRWCAVSGSRAFFTYGRCSLDIPRA